MTPNRKNYKIELLMNQLTISFLVYVVRQLLGVIMLYVSGAKQIEGEIRFERNLDVLVGSVNTRISVFSHSVYQSLVSPWPMCRN